jgi:hypothetical protein
VAAPTLLKRSRLDDSIAKLKELLADLEAGKLGREPRAIVVIDVPDGDTSTTSIYGLSMDTETISQAYFILNKALRRMDGPAR